MATYLVDDTNMKATADAIRSKTGSSLDITFDASTGFKSAIDTIKSIADTTATPDAVMAGKYFYNSSGQRVQGNVFIVCNPT